MHRFFWSRIANLLLWTACASSEPLQSIAETHLLGHRSGQRNGDTLYSALNYLFYLQICYQSGQNLSIARGKSRDFAFELLRRKQKFMLNGAWCIYLQSAALMEGLDYKDEEDSSGMLPTWDEMTPKSGKTHKDFFLGKWKGRNIWTNPSCIPLTHSLLANDCSLFDPPIHEGLPLQTIRPGSAVRHSRYNLEGERFNPTHFLLRSVFRGIGGNSLCSPDRRR